MQIARGLVRMCIYAQSDPSLCQSLEYSMTVKLLNECHLEFLSLKGGCTDSVESTHDKTFTDTFEDSSPTHMFYTTCNMAYGQNITVNYGELWTNYDLK